MSWSVSVARATSKEDAIARATAQLDTAAASYAGKPEGDDVAAAKTRILALIEATDLTPDGGNQYGINVSAHGSHSWTGKGIVSGSFSVTVSRTAL